jgi:hypothetical protein
MILPNDDVCMRVIRILTEETDAKEMTEWEYEFVTSNKGRTSFSTKQREVISRLMEKYDCD